MQGYITFSFCIRSQEISQRYKQSENILPLSLRFENVTLQKANDEFWYVCSSQIQILEKKEYDIA